MECSTIGIVRFQTRETHPNNKLNDNTRMPVKIPMVAPNNMKYRSFSFILSCRSFKGNLVQNGSKRLFRRSSILNDTLELPKNLTANVSLTLLNVQCLFLVWSLLLEFAICISDSGDECNFFLEKTVESILPQNQAFALEFMQQHVSKKPPEYF